MSYADFLFLVASGPMLVASLAYSVAILQLWFFLKRREPVWMGWGSLVCLAAALYNTVIFLNFQTNNPAGLVLLHKCLHSVLLLLLYAMANFIYSYLSRGTRLGHHLFLLSLLVWLVLIWFSPFIIMDNLASRASLWLGGYYPRPTMRPLGLVMQAFMGLVICHFFFIWPWKVRRRLPNFPYLAAGMVFWAVLAFHDILVSMGMPARLFLAEYGVLGFCFSIAGFSLTNFLALEQSLQQARQTEALARLAGGIAHDFKNILSVISMNAELLCRLAPASGPVGDCAARIMDSTRRGTGLVRGLLSLGHQDASRFEPLDLNGEVGKAARALAPILPAAISLDLSLCREELPIRGLPGQIEKIILNLALNARDAMPQGGRLTLATSKCRLGSSSPPPAPRLAAGEYCQLVVADTGLGMDHETTERVFDPFFTTKPADQGSGMGLATVQGIMETCGGAVTCQSAPGWGTIFSLYWPVADPCAAAAPGWAPAPAPTPAPTPAPGSTLMVVDDEPGIRQILGEGLRLARYRVLAASCCGEALELLRQEDQAVRVAIVDLNMPGLDGARCLGEMKAMRPGLKVILCSGFFGPGQAAPELAGAADACLAKPFSIEEVVELVRRTLGEPLPAACDGPANPVI